ncbi:MAG: aldehyde reductase [Actinomycetota bacterium]|nr:aldehyde reductase [Actinomycetota bacterium]
MPVTTSPVCVTGATGYVAGAIVQELLENGYSVRGTTRDPERAWRERHVTGLPGADQRLDLIAADLMTQGAFDSAVEGCEYVIHTASPYVTDVADPYRDLVAPAVGGTLSVLKACQAAGGVNRVVLTSSFAAITDEPDGRLLSEQDWNTKSTLKRNAYYLSKTEAERSAWRFMEESHPEFDLVVINPPFVFGPSLIPGLNTSARVLAGLTNGDFPAIIDMQWAIVDIRDLATTHRLAMEVPTASGRYLTAAGVRSLRQVVDLLRANGWAERYRLPSIPLDNAFGNSLVRFAANFQRAGARSYLKTHIGGVFSVDNSKVQNELGIQFRDVDQTVLEAMTDLERWGHLGRK